MKTWSLLLIAFLAAFLFFAGETLADSEIVVTGVGTASVMPDRARMQFIIKTRAKTTKEAAASNAEKLEDLMSLLQGAGFNREDIHTSQYMVDEIRDPKKREKIRGYLAYHSLYIRIADIARVGQIVDLVHQSGSARVGRINYVSSRNNEVRREALAKAVENARKDARVMAEAAEGELGQLIELTTHFPNNPTFKSNMMPSAMMVKGGDYPPTTSIVPRELSIKVTVLGRWNFITSAPADKQEDK